MKLVSAKTVLEVFRDLLVNLTSAWFGILVVAPGFFGAASLEEYQKLLTINLPLGIVGLMASLLLTDKSRSL